jgi:hypothetical protein
MAEPSPFLALHRAEFETVRSGSQSNKTSVDIPRLQRTLHSGRGLSQPSCLQLVMRRSPESNTDTRPCPEHRLRADTHPAPPRHDSSIRASSRQVGSQADVLVGRSVHWVEASSVMVAVRGFL